MILDYQVLYTRTPETLSQGEAALQPLPVSAYVLHVRSAPLPHDEVSVTVILQGAGHYWALHLHNMLQTFMMYFLVDMIMKRATSKVSDAFFIALYFIRRLLQNFIDLILFAVSEVVTLWPHLTPAPPQHDT